MGFEKILWRLIGGISLGLTLAGVLETPALAGVGLLESVNPWSLMLNAVYMLGEAWRQQV